MRFRFQPTSLIVGAVLGLAASFALQPLWKLGVIRWHQVAFAELIFRCDNAMRTHLLADHRLAREPSEVNVAAVRSAEIGLLDCQDYDLFRKMLLRWGLDEAALSEMTLLAIEERGEDLRKVVTVHAIRY